MATPLGSLEKVVVPSSKYFLTFPWPIRSFICPLVKHPVTFLYYWKRKKGFWKEGNIFYVKPFIRKFKFEKCKAYQPQIYPVCRAWRQCWAAWKGPASSAWPSPGTGVGTPWSGGPPAQTGSCSGRTGRRSGPAAWSATPAGLAWPAWSIPAILCRIYSKIIDVLLHGCCTRNSCTLISITRSLLASLKFIFL